MTFGDPYSFLNQSNFGNFTHFWFDNVTDVFELMLTPLWNTTQDSYLERTMYFEIDIFNAEAKDYTLYLVDAVSGDYFMSGTLEAGATTYSATFLAPIDRPLLLSLNTTVAANIAGYVYLGYVYDEPMAAATLLQAEEDTAVFLINIEEFRETILTLQAVDMALTNHRLFICKDKPKLSFTDSFATSCMEYSFANSDYESLIFISDISLT